MSTVSVNAIPNYSNLIENISMGKAKYKIFNMSVELDRNKCDELNINKLMCVVLPADELLAEGLINSTHFITVRIITPESAESASQIFYHGPLIYAKWNASLKMTLLSNVSDFPKADGPVIGYETPLAICLAHNEGANNRLELLFRAPNDGIFKIKSLQIFVQICI